jgi:hypothetical protein
MSKVAHRSWLMVVLLLVVFGFVFLRPSKLDERAWESAQQFCASLKLGDSAQDLADRAKRAGADLWSYPPDAGGSTKHIAWFGGFLANEHACNILEVGGAVKARYAEAHIW